MLATAEPVRDGILAGLRGETLLFMHEPACRLVAEALGTGRAKILEIDPSGQSALVRVGVGWSDGVVGSVRLPMREHSSETYSLKAGRPVVASSRSAMRTPCQP